MLPTAMAKMVMAVVKVLVIASLLIGTMGMPMMRDGDGGKGEAVIELGPENQQAWKVIMNGFIPGLTFSPRQNSAFTLIPSLNTPHHRRRPQTYNPLLPYAPAPNANPSPSFPPTTTTYYRFYTPIPDPPDAITNTSPTTTAAPSPPSPKEQTVSQGRMVGIIAAAVFGCVALASLAIWWHIKRKDKNEGGIFELRGGVRPKRRWWWSRRGGKGVMGMGMGAGQVWFNANSRGTAGSGSGSGSDTGAAVVGNNLTPETAVAKELLPQTESSRTQARNQYLDVPGLDTASTSDPPVWDKDYTHLTSADFHPEPQYLPPPPSTTPSPHRIPLAIAFTLPNNIFPAINSLLCCSTSTVTLMLIREVPEGSDAADPASLSTGSTQSEATTDDADPAAECVVAAAEMGGNLAVEGDGGEMEDGLDGYESDGAASLSSSVLSESDKVDYAAMLRVVTEVESLRNASMNAATANEALVGN